ncbi:cobalamin biosynthesis protein [Antrihabitans cavernicola]|uniref:Cobalamin biosynthesis protein CobD n=1 Tax=Antrihabitans cavernicola TaxID=2495913 RepID=A0A5A7SEV2_9NOCA|nr:cobalamin biosynthesis protein [Spelaeibacter cavernicola]KAA0023055.1 cobalamin biosynthesis protein [Spelaeibacter cavernicola]
MNRGGARALGLAIGYCADRVFRDPTRLHPVAGFGTAASRLEHLTYRDSRAAGAAHVAILVGGTVVFGVVLGRGGAPATALATWAVLGGSSLAATGNTMADHLEANDLLAARTLLPSLCGRDPDLLDSAGLARAALESVAENTSDATVAPLFWGAVAGVPGLVGYRAINTLDAMIGYRNDRYSRFGWAAARTDDIANLIPARLAGALTVALAPTVGGSPRQALRAWRRDAAAHPSPNAGVAEASMAGALRVTLGGRTAYRHGVEQRPELGDGPAPGGADLRRAVRLSTTVQLASAALAVAVGELVLLRDRRRRR